MPVSEFKRRIREINYTWIPSSLLIDPTMRSSPIIDPMSRWSPCRTSPPLCPRRPPPTCQPSGSATRSPPWTSGQKWSSWFEPGEKIKPLLLLAIPWTQWIVHLARRQWCQGGSGSALSQDLALKRLWLGGCRRREGGRGESPLVCLYTGMLSTPEPPPEEKR